MSVKPCEIIDYADLPRSEWLPIINRIEAEDEGLDRYFTGKPCKYGHISERHVSAGNCIVCKREYLNTHKKAYDKAYYEAHKDKCRARATAYYKANKDARDAQAKIYREANKSRRRKYAKSYYKANKEKVDKHNKKYREANNDKIAAHREANRDDVNAYKRAATEAKNLFQMLGALSTLSQIEE